MRRSRPSTRPGWPFAACRCDGPSTLDFAGAGAGNRGYRPAMRPLLLLLLVIRVQVPNAWACSCDFVDPVDAAEASGVAYVGEFVSVGEEPEHEHGGPAVGLFGCGGADHEDSEPTVSVGSDEGPVVVRVLTTLHGDVTEGDEITLTLYLGGQGGDCSVDPAVGDRWFFYTTDVADTISLCSPEGPWSQDTEDALREAFGG